MPQRRTRKPVQRMYSELFDDWCRHVADVVSVKQSSGLRAQVGRKPGKGQKAKGKGRGSANTGKISFDMS
eukprot:27882-Eustigmatos_ZCMA.PRE.1